MTKPSHAQNTYFHRDPFPHRRGDVRLSSRGAFSPSVVPVVVPDGEVIAVGRANFLFEFTARRQPPRYAHRLC